MAQPFDEVLSRLNARGATSLGGSDFANFLVRTDDDGLIDSSLFTSTLSTYTVATEGDLPISAKNGEIAILTDTATYRYNEAANGGLGGWEIIAYLSTTNVPFNPAGTPLSGTDVQTALSELANRAVLTDTDSTISGIITFDVADDAPFVVTSSSRTHIVGNLNSELLGGYTLNQVLNVANHTGYIPANHLNPAVTYPINIGGTAASSVNSIHANSAGALDPGVVVAEATHAGTATSATSSTSSTNASFLLDGASVPRNYAYFLNVANMTAGTLPAGRFNATSHGNLAGGSLHALAIADTVITTNGLGQVTSTSGGTPGFMSSADAYKLSTVGYGAGVNQNAFSKFYTGVTSSGSPVYVTATSVTDILSLLSGDTAVGIAQNVSARSITLTLNRSNILHNSLGGLTTGDPHTQYVSTTIARSIDAQHSFANPTGPFSVESTATVENLSADLLDGQDGSYYLNIANIQDKAVGESYPAWLTTLIGAPSGIQVYRALLSQTGTAAPTALVLENTLTPTITWARSAAGQYSATFSSAPLPSKTIARLGTSTSASGTSNTFAMNTSTPTSYLVYSANTGTLQDNLLNHTPVEIIVYP